MVGTLFVLLVGRFLLPSRHAPADRSSHFQLEDYLSEFIISEKSPFLNQTVDDVEADPKYHFKVLGLIRKGRRLRAPYKQERLAAGDVLVVRAPPDELLAIREEPDHDLHPVKLFGDRIAQVKS